MNNSLMLNNLSEALGKTKRDEAVGIKIVKLTGNDTLAFYAAEIESHKRVGAHYHTQGTEIYQIVKGQGEIYIGIPGSEQVDWKEPVTVKAGDCFTVNELEVHQLVNTGNEQLIIIFACPFSHISTDRIVVPGLKDFE
ncbi:MAG: cupin domain-containing protein [Peptococcaceae bacterium]